VPINLGPKIPDFHLKIQQFWYMCTILVLYILSMLFIMALYS